MMSVEAPENGERHTFWTVDYSEERRVSLSSLDLTYRTTTSGTWTSDDYMRRISPSDIGRDFYATEAEALRVALGLLQDDRDALQEQIDAHLKRLSELEQGDTRAEALVKRAEGK